MARLKRCDAIADCSIGVETKKKLRSVYYDTPDFSLKARKLALRVRHDGTRKIQTVKSESRSGVISDRDEYEAELGTDRPDIGLVSDRSMRRKLNKALSHKVLQPQFETDINRTVRMLRTERGDAIELAIDEGFIAANGDNELVSEIELELKNGTASGLYDVVRGLGEGVHLAPTILSKADRGFALASGTKAKPSRGKAIKLSPKATSEDAFVAIMRECSRHLLANERLVLETRDPEGLHQMRVALRRLRAALSLLDRVAHGDLLEMLSEEAKWIGEALGFARDTDVFAAEIFAPVAQAMPTESALPHMADALARLREEAWGDALSALESRRYSEFVLELGAAVENRSWRVAGDKKQHRRLDGRARDTGRLLLSKHLRKTALLGDRISGLSIEERHDMRKKLKKLRYTGEFFSPLFKKKAAKRYLSQLAKAQDVFGYLNDVSTAENIVSRLIFQEPDQMDIMMWSGGLVLGWHQHRANAAWTDAKALWHELSGTPHFWD